MAIEIFRLFRKSHDYGFRDQIQRAAVSVPSNIAEGYERDTNKEYIRFLYISRGSSGELRTQIHLAAEVELVKREEAEHLIERTRKISAMLSKLIQT
ncbi:MAG: four helix bundle protein [Bacteroidetes bacterium]|nr:four helix bundle protein [Bacteroidota bacterium]